ncbi:cyclic nucleotide-binding domain-containing protein 2-like isoform X3 [Hydractinia symbiolongicarpus]|uniref:cyclic nucleotide-binding domain-containing protein 2-like isoform X3 n=1 Tax=Hydractinia symbiolongicarpus TaxID=13093 RepID=UPI00254CA6FC|nr:cyclic nucleotide-binding domain-containing protein 2-like isoform X3 [Hydractinia symbiolongicarpus]
MMEKYRLTTLRRSYQHRSRRRNSSQTSSTVSNSEGERNERKEICMTKHTSAITNFKRAVKMVKVVNLLRPKNTSKMDELSKVDTYITFAEFAKDMRHKSSTALFDPTLYRANKEMRISSEARETLRLPQKSKLQIEKTVLSLRSIKSFAEYPTRMQRKLVEVGWYERHSAKNMILRQGHPPQAFYFILSGKAVVKVLSTKDKVPRTICYLKRGDSFGELSIIHSTNRQATIITEECIELLCIAKKDFVDIFMSSGPGEKNVYDPDFASFVGEIKFLKLWPVHQLHNEPKHCLFNYFKNDAVLVKDSKYSDWIYIIKSGSCRVLIKLHKINTQPTGKNDDNFFMQRRIHKKVPVHQNYSPTTTRTHLINNSRPKTCLPERQSKICKRKGRSPVFSILLVMTYTQHSNCTPGSTMFIKIIVFIEMQQSTYSNQKISIIDSSSTQNVIATETRGNSACFVQIATLEKTDTFGLQNIFCKKQPSLILISNGAEIFMISKKHFLKHCSQECYHELERTVPEYPTNHKLQQQLEDDMRWREFKRNEIVDVVRRCKSAKI